MSASVPSYSAPSPGDISALYEHSCKVALNFVRQYYTMLHTDPSQLHRYRDLILYSLVIRTPGDLIQYSLVSRTPGDLIHYNLVSRTPGDLIHYNLVSRTPGDLVQYTLVSRTPGDCQNLFVLSGIRITGSNNEIILYYIKYHG